MCSYKQGYKSPKRGYNYGYPNNPTYNYPETLKGALDPKPYRILLKEP